MHMANVLRALTFLVLIDLARYAAGWPASACIESCTTMQVNHYFDEDYDPIQYHYHGWDWTPPPYYPSTPGDGGFYLSINASRYANGTAKNGTALYTPRKTYNMTLQGNQTFRGFIVRPSLSPLSVSDELSEGTGLVDSAANPPVQMRCSDQAVCHRNVCHGNVYEKEAVWFLWHAPAENYTCIYFHFTVLVNYTIYYVDMIFEVCGDPTPPPSHFVVTSSGDVSVVSTSLFSQHTKESLSATKQARSLATSLAQSLSATTLSKSLSTAQAQSWSTMQTYTGSRSATQALATTGSLHYHSPSLSSPSLTTFAQSSSQSSVPASSTVRLLPLSTLQRSSLPDLIPTSTPVASTSSSSGLLPGLSSSTRKDAVSDVSRTLVLSSSVLTAATKATVLSTSTSAHLATSAIQTSRTGILSTVHPTTLQTSTSRATVLSTVRSATYDSVPASVSLSVPSTSSLATRRITPSPHGIGTGQPTSISPPPYNDKSNLSGGALAGIIIGCCLAFVACFAVGVQIYRRKLKSRGYDLAKGADTLTMFYINENESVQFLLSSDETTMGSSDEMPTASSDELPTASSDEKPMQRFV